MCVPTPQPAQHRTPPTPPEFPCLDLRVPDLPKGFCASWDLLPSGFITFLSHFTAPLPSSRIGCSPSPPPVTPGTSAAPRTCWSRAAAAPVLAGPRAAALQARPRGRACTLMVPPAVRGGTGSDPGLRVKPSSLGHTTSRGLPRLRCASLAALAWVCTGPVLSLGWKHGSRQSKY